MATGLRRVTNSDGQNDDSQSMDYPKNTIAKEYYNNNIYWSICKQGLK